MLPLTGSTVGGGDTGVWILPRSTFIGSVAMVVSSYSSGNLTASSPRVRITGSVNESMSMRVSGEMRIPPVAVVVDPISGVQLNLGVVGGIVVLTPRIIGLVGASVSGVAIGTIVDAQGRGYMLAISVDAARESVTARIW